MTPGKVIGKVTLSDGARQFRGARWLVVEPLDAGQLAGTDEHGRRGKWTPVVYDALGADAGDTILFIEGAEATQPFDEPIPLDAISVAILDAVEFNPPS